MRNIARHHRDWFAREHAKAEKEDTAGAWHALRLENERKLADIGRRVLQFYPDDATPEDDAGSTP